MEIRETLLEVGGVPRLIFIVIAATCLWGHSHLVNSVILYFPATIDDAAGLDIRNDLEELGHVERDGEDDDEELVELDVVLGEERGEPELAVVADADVTLEAGRDES